MAATHATPEQTDNPIPSPSKAARANALQTGCYMRSACLGAASLVLGCVIVWRSLRRRRVHHAKFLGLCRAAFDPPTPGVSRRHLRRMNNNGALPVKTQWHFC